MKTALDPKNQADFLIEIDLNRTFIVGVFKS